MDNGDVTAMGKIVVCDDTEELLNSVVSLSVHPYSLLIEFDNIDSLKTAISNGSCGFTIFGEQAIGKQE